MQRRPNLIALKTDIQPPIMRWRAYRATGCSHKILLVLYSSRQYCQKNGIAMLNNHRPLIRLRTVEKPADLYYSGQGKPFVSSCD